MAHEDNSQLGDQNQSFMATPLKAGCSVFFSSSPSLLPHYSTNFILPSSNGAIVIRKLGVVAEQKSAGKNNRGWFYKTFVANQTMDAKLEKFKADVAARNGFVGSWFNDSFKYTAWVEVHKRLTERNLKSITCKEAYNMAKLSRAILLDVRESQDFEQVHAEGAWNAPLFQLIQGNSFEANLRRLGYAFLTDFSGTERNPNFINQVMDATGGDKRKVVVVMCSIGGTLLTYVERRGTKYKKFSDPERKFGRQSRSLKAIYELQEVGFTNVVHLKDGLNQWIHEGLPIDGSNTYR